MHHSFSVSFTGKLDPPTHPASYLVGKKTISRRKCMPITRRFKNTILQTKDRNPYKFPYIKIDSKD